MPLHVVNQGFERDELSNIILEIVYQMVAKVPPESLPAMVTKKRVRSIAKQIVDNLTTEQLLDLTSYANFQLNTLFEKVAADWMKEKIGMQDGTKFAETRKALEKTGVAIVE